MASGASGLHAGSSQQDLFAVIDRLVDELKELRGQRDDHKKDLTEKKSFDKVPTFDGNEKDFTDFEFKFQQFVRPFKYFEQFLDWIKNLDEEPEIGELQHKAQQTAQGDPKVDILWYDEQLYGVLSLITTSTALQTVKNLRTTRASEAARRGTRSPVKLLDAVGFVWRGLRIVFTIPNPCLLTRRQWLASSSGRMTARNWRNSRSSPSRT